VQTGRPPAFHCQAPDSMNQWNPYRKVIRSMLIHSKVMNWIEMNSQMRRKPSTQAQEYLKE